MALVNPNIAMSFRQPEFRPRNAMAEYAQMQQIQGGQRQAEVADMQLESLRRERDALSQIQAAIVAKGGPPDLDAAADAMIKTGRPEYVTQGMAIHTARRNQRNAEAYFKQYGGGAAPTMPSSTPGAMTAPAELAAGAQPESMAPVPGVISASRVPGVVTTPITAPMGTMREIAPGGGMGAEMPLAPANALAPLAAAPVNAMAAPAAPDANAARIKALEAQYRQIGNNPELASERALVLKQIETAMRGDQNRPLVVGNRLVSPTGQELFASPERTDTDLIRNFNAAKAQGFKGNLFDYQREIAMAGRAPAAPVQPVAPTITQIVDPANPNQMITIDARRYQGGGVGSPGVLGVGGKEPAAAVRENKVEAGKSQLADDLENLRASFLVLDKIRAIPSTERNPLSNLASFTAASGVGQIAGRAFSTEAQVEREVINSARTRLVNSIKNATGMSAQQLNSNVELQTMLKSISDPAQPVQAALRIIEDIENAYVKGAGMPKKNAPARSLTPQDQEALNWANSNPNDPRAAQIRQRLGATK
jgi:hypothetical protein